MNRHQYDRAKEGYFNLLPVQFKHSLEPGDGKEQLDARRAFVMADFFKPLVHGLVNVIPRDVDSLLDVGCGEGYFTRALGAHCKKAEIYGIDIAKAGIRLAAKNADGRFTYAVASSYALPLADSSMDVITRIYAPSKDEELHRVLAPEGKLIIVTPGEQHLINLRQRIYDQIKPHQLPKTPNGFVEVDIVHLNFDLDVPAGVLTSALLHMTPFAWRLTEELKLNLVKTGLTDFAHFQISIYQKQ